MSYGKSKDLCRGSGVEPCAPLRHLLSKFPFPLLHGAARPELEPSAALAQPGPDTRSLKGLVDGASPSFQPSRDQATRHGHQLHLDSGATGTYPLKERIAWSGAAAEVIRSAAALGLSVQPSPISQPSSATSEAGLHGSGPWPSDPSPAEV